MKKVEALKEIKKMQSVYVNVIPTKATEEEKKNGTSYKHNSGAHGNSFEALIKLELNGRVNSKYLTSKGAKNDITFKGKKIQVKSGSGTLDGMNGTDYVIYSHDATLENARVLTTENFINAVDMCGMRRIKKMSDGTKKETLQSFRNSMKKFALWTGTIEQCGFTLDEFKALYQ